MGICRRFVCFDGYKTSLAKKKQSGLVAKSLVFPQQQNFAMGSLAQISSGAIWCSFSRFRTRFRRVPVQIPGAVPVQRVPVQIAGEVPEGSVQFRRVPVQRADTL